MTFIDRDQWCDQFEEEQTLPEDIEQDDEEVRHLKITCECGYEQPFILNTKRFAQLFDYANLIEGTHI